MQGPTPNGVVESIAQQGLNAAIAAARKASNDAAYAHALVARAGRELAEDLDQLRTMHSQLAQLNVEHQKTIEILADALLDLYSIAAPFMCETDSVWRATQEGYVAAMKLVGRDPKI